MMTLALMLFIRVAPQKPSRAAPFHTVRVLDIVRRFFSDCCRSRARSSLRVRLSFVSADSFANTQTGRACRLGKTSIYLFSPSFPPPIDPDVGLAPVSVTASVPPSRIPGSSVRHGSPLPPHTPELRRTSSVGRTFTDSDGERQTAPGSFLSRPQVVATRGMVRINRHKGHASTPRGLQSKAKSVNPASFDAYQDRRDRDARKGSRRQAIRAKNYSEHDGRNALIR